MKMKTLRDHTWSMYLDPTQRRKIMRYHTQSMYPDLNPNLILSQILHKMTPRQSYILPVCCVIVLWEQCLIDNIQGHIQQILFLSLRRSGWISVVVNE